MVPVESIVSIDSIYSRQNDYIKLHNQSKSQELE